MSINIPVEIPHACMGAPLMPVTLQFNNFKFSVEFEESLKQISEDNEYGVYFEVLDRKGNQSMLPPVIMYTHDQHAYNFKLNPETIRYENDEAREIITSLATYTHKEDENTFISVKIKMVIGDEDERDYHSGMLLDSGMYDARCKKCFVDQGFVSTIGDGSDSITTLVMENLDGTIEDYTKSNQLPLTVYLHITERVTLAIQQLLSIGLLYTDLKLENVMYRCNGANSFIVKLIDSASIHDYARSPDDPLGHEQMNSFTAFPPATRFSDQNNPEKTMVWLIAYFLFEMITNSREWNVDDKVSLFRDYIYSDEYEKGVFQTVGTPYTAHMEAALNEILNNSAVATQSTVIDVLRLMHQCMAFKEIDRPFLADVRDTIQQIIARAGAGVTPA